MTARVVLSRAALRDIETILEYLSREAGGGVASGYRRSLTRLFTLLNDRPALGSPRPRLGRGVRLSIVAPYLVFYRQVDGTTTVLRVLHGRRRITEALLRRTT